jgi:hypothetical protein
VDAERVFWRTVARPINRWRRESLGLAPTPFWGPFDLLYERRTPFIYGFSRFVVPRTHDWPEWHHIAGYWFLNGTDAWSPLPSIVTPFFGDQSHWGQRVHDLGVGPQPILRTRLTADRLANAIAQVSADQSMKRRAAALGERIRAQDGVGRAVEIVNRYVTSSGAEACKRYDSVS